jgi:hypothetical protein
MMFGSLNTSITERGVYVTLSGWSTTLIDLIVPFAIFEEIYLKVLIDLLEIALIECAFLISISEYTDFV